MNWFQDEPNRPNLDELVGRLAADGFVDDEQKLALDAAASDAELAVNSASLKTPWYVQLLVGVSAWLAAIFFIGFLVVAEIVQSETSALIVGAILMVVALGLKYLLKQTIFVDQVAFAVSLVGQGLLIGGIGAQFDSLLVGALAAIGLEVLLYFIYPDSLHRFVSVILLAVALMVLAFEREVMDLTHLYVLGAAAGAVLVWQKDLLSHDGRWGELLRPLRYGLPVALFGISLLSLFSELEIAHWWLSAAAVALVLIYLGMRILGELDMAIQSAAGIGMVVALVVLSIPAIQTPGILAAILVLVVGFWRNNQLLLGLAAAFLLFFLGAYYYNLDITLLNKSFVLMATGVVLLLLRFVVGRWGGLGDHPA